MSETSKLRPRRNYKDEVFRLLFRDKEQLLSLYNAISKRNYTDVNLLEVVTLEDAIYMYVKNDLAFTIDCSLYLYEHQSTIPTNLPLRFLAYVDREYAGMIAGQDMYSSTKIYIPEPHFLVLYNGTRPMPERQELRLSDAYFKKSTDPMLELRIQVLNINQGFNEDIKAQCKTLQEYTRFVETVRRYCKIYQNTPAAMAQAIEECIQQDVLADFLRKHRSEAMSWSLYEFDAEAYESSLKKDAYAEGKEEGIEEGIDIGMGKGKLQMLQDLFIQNEISLDTAVRMSGLSQEAFTEQISAL